jgi:hypothetical protein
MAAFGGKVSSHGKAHDAETEKSDFSHVCYLGFSSAITAELAERVSLEAPRLAGGHGFVLEWPDNQGFKTMQNTGSDVA